MSVGLPSVCLSVPAVQEQKVCTASVDRQTHHNSLILSQLMSWGRGKGRVQGERSQEGKHIATLWIQTGTCKHPHLEKKNTCGRIVHICERECDKETV